MGLFFGSVLYDQRRALRRFLFALDTAKDGVDHACGVGCSVGTRHLHTFVDGGVRRDAVHVQQLEDAEAEGEKGGVVELAILGGVLFGMAGRLDWPAAWLVILLFTGHLVLSGWLLFHRNPELLEERLTTASNVPQWDRLIARGNRILLPIFLATAALDAGRFGWSAMAMVVRAIGTAAVKPYPP